MFRVDSGSGDGGEKISTTVCARMFRQLFAIVNDHGLVGYCGSRNANHLVLKVQNHSQAHFCLEKIFFQQIWTPYQKLEIGSTNPPTPRKWEFWI